MVNKKIAVYNQTAEYIFSDEAQKDAYLKKEKVFCLEAETEYWNATTSHGRKATKEILTNKRAVFAEEYGFVNTGGNEWHLKNK